MNNYYALFNFGSRHVLVRYISATWIGCDIDDAITRYSYAKNWDDQAVIDCDGLVKTIMDSFNVEYKIVNFDNYIIW